MFAKIDKYKFLDRYKFLDIPTWTYYNNNSFIYTDNMLQSWS